VFRRNLTVWTKLLFLPNLKFSKLFFILQRTIYNLGKLQGKLLHLFKKTYIFFFFFNASLHARVIRCFRGHELTTNSLIKRIILNHEVSNYNQQLGSRMRPISSTHAQIGKTIKSLLSLDLSTHVDQNLTANVLTTHFLRKIFVVRLFVRNLNRPF